MRELLPLVLLLQLLPVLLLMLVLVVTGLAERLLEVLLLLL
jgi:hypothetical protein